MTQTKIDEIIQFWFGDLQSGDADKAIRQRWFKKDAAFDQHIQKRFAAEMQAAADGHLDQWQSQASGSLALLILLDQFPRNVYRNSPQGWSNDPKAQQVSLAALEIQQDRDLLPVQRAFMYMPLMHAENLALQKRCVELFSDLVATEGDGFQNNLDFARSHAEIIERFGRFPHRNAVLGRENTAEETEFLKTHSGF